MATTARVTEPQFRPDSPWVAHGSDADTIEVRPTAPHAWTACGSKTAHAASIYCLKRDPTQTRLVRHVAKGSNNVLVSIWDLKEMVSLRKVDH